MLWKGLLSVPTLTCQPNPEDNKIDHPTALPAYNNLLIPLTSYLYSFVFLPVVEPSFSHVIISIGFNGHQPFLMQTMPPVASWIHTLILFHPLQWTLALLLMKYHSTHVDKIFGNVNNGATILVSNLVTLTPICS